MELENSVKEMFLPNEMFLPKSLEEKSAPTSKKKRRFKTKVIVQILGYLNFVLWMFFIFCLIIIFDSKCKRSMISSKKNK